MSSFTAKMEYLTKTRQLQLLPIATYSFHPKIHLLNNALIARKFNRDSPVFKGVYRAPHFKKI
jgi:hypothetical protein